MRVFTLCVALLFPTLALSQTVVRQGYSGGTPTLGGCTGPVATDNSTAVVGQCIANSAGNSSLWLNDCWGNGVLSSTFYNGSTTCDPAFASTVAVDIAAQATTTSPLYCNMDQNPVDFNTYTCSNATIQPSNQVVRAFAYPGANNCSGTPLVTTDIPVGVCTPLQGTNPPLYALANCANGLVTSVFYSTSNCSIVFNSTGSVISAPIPFGPYAQINATSANDKVLGSAGSTCAFNNGAYVSYQCLTVTPSSTGTTGSSTATTGSTGTNGTTSSTTTGTTSSTGSSTGIIITTTTTGTTTTTSSTGIVNGTTSSTGTTGGGNATTSPPTKPNNDAHVVTVSPGIAGIIILLAAQFA